MSNRIDPNTPSGFRDYLPADAVARQDMMDRVATVFRRFGFTAIDTPVMERLEVLTGGDPGFSKQIYRARITDDDEPLGMRFDLTVPLARFVAAHADKLQMPFARYHIGKCWRGEHAQAGRYREFVQCDADIIGATSMAADAQVIAMAYAVYAELGLSEHLRIRISNRKLINGLSDFLQFDSSKTPDVLRAIDKLDKQEWQAVASELSDKVGLDSQQIDAIQEFLNLKADTAEGLLDKVHLMLQFETVSSPGITELREVFSHLDSLGIPRSALDLDLSLVRGQGYYSGTVLEFMLNNAPQFGAVGSGGRYDDLVSRFAPMELSGVGISIGMDRLFAVLDELGLVKPMNETARVALLNFDPTCHETILSLSATLRSNGIATSLYLGNDDNLKGQLAWAVKGEFPFVVIIGTNEKERGVVQLKDMSARTQEEVPLEEILQRLIR